MGRECNNIVLACDIDDTLLAVDSRSYSERRGSEKSLGELCAFIENERSANGRQLCFGSVTGRTLASHREREQQNRTFAAAAAIMNFKVTAVGSEAHTVKAGKHIRVPGWPNAPGWDRASIAKALSGRPELIPHPPIAQGPHKLSFDVHTPKGDPDEYVKKIIQELARLKLPAEIIFSSNRFLDFLPLGVHKGTGLLRTIGALSLKHGKPLVLAAGDSLNDRDLLQAADRAILPGNAHDSLKQWARRTISPQKLYLAKNNFAAGILEGYRHFCA